MAGRMNALPMKPRFETARPELEPLMAMLFMMVDEIRSVVIHVTAANHAEGTSTIAREIAAAAAASGWCKVALINASLDLATSNQAALGKAKSAPPPTAISPADGVGLIEYFERGEEPILQSARIGALSISTGNLSGNGRPVTRVESVRGLYTALRSSFDLIIVDYPPVLTGHQTAAFASVADGTILVIEAERTRVTDVTRAREALEQLGASIIGLVLNKRSRRIPKIIRRFL